MQTMVQTPATPRHAACRRSTEHAQRACRGMSARREDMTMVESQLGSFGDVALIDAGLKAM